MGQKFKFALALLLLSFASAGQVQAGQVSAAVNITMVRPYSTGSAGYFYIVVSNSNFCGTSQFSMPLSDLGAQGMLAVAIAALTTGKTVNLEISNTTACTVENGWGPQLQSIYLNN